MIWCVEDDPRIREIEAYALRSAGFDIKEFENGKKFWEALETQKPELVLLDVMLPEIDGIELLKRLKETEEYKDIPVIMATAKGEEYDRIKGLDLGADDYSISGVSLNLEEHTVTVDGKRLQLTYKEFELLRIFLSHPGKVYAREQLFIQVWNTDYMGDSRTLDMHIRTLRQKLGEYGKMIETVRNVGYRLEVDYDKKNI